MEKIYDVRRVRSGDSSYLLIFKILRLTQNHHSPIILVVQPQKCNVLTKEVAKTR